MPRLGYRLSKQQKRINKMKNYILVYRCGGRDNGQWKKTLVIGNHEMCREKAIEVETMGYPALVLTVAGIEKIGLPDADASDYNVFNFVPGMAKIMGGNA